MLIVRLFDDPIALDSYSEHRPDALLPFLKEQFPEWPPTARLYRDSVAASCDITPTCDLDLEALTDNGLYIVVVYPADPVTALLVGVAIFAALTAVTLAFFMPKVPEARNTTQSANNTLGNRTNEPRPNARIPDIFGTVRSIPDLLAVPYRIFDDHRELEISYFCIGRGSYLVEDVRDGDSLAASISGVSIAVYGPHTSPNSGHAPQLQIGTPIGDPLFNVRRLNEVNGQVLRAPNDEAVRADEEITFADGGIVSAAGGTIDFTDYFETGDEIEIGGAEDEGVNPNPEQLIRSARALAGGTLVFDSYDPSADFQVGQLVTITSATWSFSSGEPSGDTPIFLDGGNVSNRFQEVDEL